MAAVLASLAVVGCTTGMQSQQPMSFFVTSVGKGNGADLGGLAGLAPAEWRRDEEGQAEA